MSRPRFLAALTAVLSIATLPSCASPPVVPPAAPVVAPAPPSPPRGPDAARFHVLMINGGGNPDINFQPHLLHLRALRDTLVSSGIRADRISIFSGDGSDPAPDLVSRQAEPESDFWMLRDTRLEHPLEMPRLLVSSQIPDARLEAATKAGLTKWFDDESRILRPGDTLLLYVTDHGNRSGPDPMTNTIQLWGRGEQLSVTELGALFHELPAGVRVVSLMSQCFSGAFAALSSPAATPDAGAPTNVCGYFSSTADRPAYGCFPENAGKERVGHSFHFIRALASSRHMSDAHDEVLSADDTPDVPLRSSEAFLADLLDKVAGARSVSSDALIAELLGPAWRDQPAWHDDRVLADRIAGAFGLPSPASLADLDSEGAELFALGKSFATSARAWKGALSDATSDNLDGFLAANSAWNERVSDAALKTVNGDAARSLTATLLAELVPWTHMDKGDRLDTLEHKEQLSEAAAYRMEVRLAAVLRLRGLLTSVAGRAYLDRFGTPKERDDYAALRACEDVTLPGAPATAAASAEAGELRTTFPAIADEKKLEQDVHPGWIGITFSPIRDDLRKERKLPDGVSLVTSVYPTSPAKDGGLEPGDLLLGPPGKPFTAKGQIRAWTMLSPVDQPGTIKVQRAGKVVEVTLRPRLFPAELPAVPPATGPAIASPAPAVGLRRYRGESVNLKDGKPHLLVFWATWCGPCKASLPEVLAFERAHHTQVLAITNEAPATLEAFFKGWKKPFPRTVAIDDLNAAFIAYAVGSTPTFVLIDGKGIVQARSSGYSSSGLPFDGWKWDGK